MKILNFEEVMQELIQKHYVIYNPITNQYEISKLLPQFPQSYGFEQIAISQNKQSCSSRLDVDIESEIIKGVFRPIPLIASNMSTVVNSKFYIKLYELGAFAVLHRAQSVENMAQEVKEVAKNCQWVAASIGTTKDQFSLAKDLISYGCNILCIDIAHGYSDAVIEMAKRLKAYNSNIKVIAGNTTNVQFLYDSYKHIDAIKVGIAQGFACETKNTAGCTEKQFTTIYKFRDASKELGIPVISDGGIREAADFTKAIAAGANSIMAGSIFARCPESAAETVDFNGIKKVYAGMASRYVQDKWRGGVKEGTCTEGKITYLDIGCSAEHLVEKYSGALRSGITYAGARNIKEFQQKASFILI